MARFNQISVGPEVHHPRTTESAHHRRFVPVADDAAIEGVPLTVLIGGTQHAHGAGLHTAYAITGGGPDRFIRPIQRRPPPDRQSRQTVRPTGELERCCSAPGVADEGEPFEPRGVRHRQQVRTNPVGGQFLGRQIPAPAYARVVHGENRISLGKYADEGLERRLGLSGQDLAVRGEPGHAQHDGRTRPVNLEIDAAGLVKRHVGDPVEERQPDGSRSTP